MQGGYGEESLRPVTIKQLLDVEEAYPGADFVVDTMTLTQVTLVGQVRGVNAQSTHITYKVDDGTNVIDVKKWVDPDKPGDGDARYSLDQYVRVWGRLKSFNGRRHVGAHYMRAIDDFNEVTYHLLEATYVHLALSRVLPAGGRQAGGDGGNQAGNGGDSTLADQQQGSVDSKAAKCSSAAKRVYNFMHNSPGGNEGLHLNMIASGTGMGVREALTAADELLSCGPHLHHHR